jgi:hypothetical protein
MTIKEINTWHKWIRQVDNGYHMSDQDYRELLQLNHQVMTIANKIHNQSMLKK